jgi:hypothetical protein
MDQQSLYLTIKRKATEKAKKKKNSTSFEIQLHRRSKLGVRISLLLKHVLTRTRFMLLCRKPEVGHRVCATIFYDRLLVFVTLSQCG